MATDSFNSFKNGTIKSRGEELADLPMLLKERGHNAVAFKKINFNFGVKLSMLCGEDPTEILPRVRRAQGTHTVTLA